jgi:Fic family protein
LQLVRRQIADLEREAASLKTILDRIEPGSKNGQLELTTPAPTKPAGRKRRVMNHPRNSDWAALVYAGLHPNKGRTVKEIAQVTGVSQATVARQLPRLAEAKRAKRITPPEQTRFVRWVRGEIIIRPGEPVA